MTSGRAARDHVGEASHVTAWTLWSQATSESRAGRSGSRAHVSNRGSRKMLPKRAMNGRTVSSAMPGLSVRRLHAREIALGLKQNGRFLRTPEENADICHSLAAKIVAGPCAMDQFEIAAP